MSFAAVPASHNQHRSPSGKIKLIEPNQESSAHEQMNGAEVAMVIPEPDSGEVTEGFLAAAVMACLSSNVNQKYQSSLSTVKPTRSHVESLLLFLHQKVNITPA